MGRIRRNFVRAGIAAAFVVLAGGLNLPFDRGMVRAGTSGGGIDLQAEFALLLNDPDGNQEITLPGIGQQVFFAVVYQLSGTNTAVEMDVSASIDGQAFCAGPIDAEPDQELVIVCPGGWTATAGTHTLHWELDDTNMVSEVDETNNSADFTFTVANVDLVAERASFRTQPGGGDEVAAPVAGQGVFFHLDYELNGIDSPVTLNLRALIDDEVWCDGTVDLNPGALTVFCQGEPWVAPMGDHVLRWELDYTDIITETDETNNDIELPFTVAAPANVDLHAVRAFLVGDSEDGPEITKPTPGQNVFFYIDYETVGADAPVHADVSAFLDGVIDCGGGLDLGPGTGSVFCPAWVATAGFHTLRWVIDGGNAIIETDETNNSASLRFRVGDVAACEGDCNGDGEVSTDELVRAVHILLGMDTLENCGPLDADMSGMATVDEAVAAVDNAVNGCVP